MLIAGVPFQVGRRMMSDTAAGDAVHPSSPAPAGDLATMLLDAVARAPRDDDSKKSHPLKSRAKQKT
jgi:hypothetical protein